MSQTPTAEQIIARLELEVADLKSSRDRCMEKLTKWHLEIEAVRTLCNGAILTPETATLREKVEALISWGRGLDRWRLENLSKWGQMIQCGLSPDQPELLIFIDEALRERTKLQNALAFMLNNIGNPCCLETRERFAEAQELLPTVMRQDPKNARIPSEAKP